jgi:tRNA threonylcarbamoyladenosine biosynthesis protein TsaB
MFIFSIEQSTTVCSVALTEGYNIIAERKWEDTRIRNQYFFSVFPEILKEASITPATIDTFAVGLGPGSFSGLRCALSAINGLSLPDKKRVYGITSTEILAWQIMQKTARNSVIILGDARRGYIWYACYDRVKDVPVRRIPVSLVLSNQLSAKLCDCEIVATSDWDRIGIILKESAFPGVVIEERCIPSAHTVGELAFKKMSMNLPSEPLLPIYLHPAVAERSVSAGK